MNSELKEISPTERKITVTIEPESLKETYNSVSRKYADRANIPGFRKGYAPLDIVRMEEILLDSMFILPTEKKVKELVITKEMVERKVPVFEVVSRTEEAA